MEDVVNCHNLPSITVTKYPDTRVSFASKLFGTLFASHCVFRLVGHDDFPKVFDKLSAQDWKTMQEMEAICLALAAYTVNEAQKLGAFISSLQPYFCLALLAVTKKKKFRVMDMTRHSRGTKLHQIRKMTRGVEDSLQEVRHVLHV